MAKVNKNYKYLGNNPAYITDGIKQPAQVFASPETVEIEVLLREGYLVVE